MVKIQEKSKSQFHIITCGTSLIGNYFKKTAKPEFTKGEINQLSQSSNEWFEISKVLLDFLKEDPKANSAEVNSLSHFLQENNVERIYLICTDTKSGLLCARVLEEYFNQKHNIMNIDFKQAEGFGTENFEKGILEIRDTIIRLIKNHKKKYDIYLNATGGFKPESAVLVLLGSLYEVPVYYLYETSKNLVIIPPFPLLYIKEEFTKILEKLFNQPAGIRTRKEIEKFEREFGEKLKYLERVGTIEVKKRKDGTREYRITEAGKLLYKFREGDL